jgi:hypothetical protein
VRVRSPLFCHSGERFFPFRASLTPPHSKPYVHQVTVISRGRRQLWNEPGEDDFRLESGILGCTIDHSRFSTNEIPCPGRRRFERGHGLAHGEAPSPDIGRVPEWARMQVDGHDFTEPPPSITANDSSRSHRVASQITTREDNEGSPSIGAFAGTRMALPLASHDRPPTASSAGWAFEPDGTECKGVR